MFYLLGFALVLAEQFVIGNFCNYVGHLVSELFPQILHRNSCVFDRVVPVSEGNEKSKVNAKLAPVITVKPLAA